MVHTPSPNGADGITEPVWFRSTHFVDMSRVVLFMVLLSEEGSWWLLFDKRLVNSSTTRRNAFVNTTRGRWKNGALRGLKYVGINM